ncbi:MAG: HIT family protein [Pseudomonadota bacterium]
MTTYDDDNIFAKILRGEIPSHRVYEDDDVLVIMDVMPQADGHTLVIPKAPSRNLLDADPIALGAVIATTQLVAQASKRAFHADGITIQQFNEAAGGQSVFHLHFHVIPRHDGQPLKPHTGQMADQAALAAHCDKIKAEMSVR